MSVCQACFTSSVYNMLMQTSSVYNMLMQWQSLHCWTFYPTFKPVSTTDWYTWKVYFVFWVNHVAFKLHCLSTFLPPKHSVYPKALHCNRWNLTTLIELIELIPCRTDTFKHSSFLWTFVEWNKLDLKCRKCTCNIFRNHLLKSIQPLSNPLYIIFMIPY